MYYKLLNKNLLTAALASLITLSAAKTCDAQGVVSLVEDNNAVAPQKNTAKAVKPSANLVMDSELPDSIQNDDDVIPLDSGLISPAPAAKIPAAAAKPDEDKPAPQAAAKDNAGAPVADVKPVANGQEPNPENFDADMDFSLGMENVENADVKAPLPAGVKAPANNNAAAPSPLGAPAPAASPLMAAQPEAPKPAPVNKDFGDGVLEKVNNDLFNQMSDIEKQTTLLTLELRREKVRNEIEAIKAQRDKAMKEQLAADEEKKRQEFEWKKEQEAKVLREQQLLKEKEIELEKLKQKKALTAYMNQMLEQNQNWIAENAKIYKQMQQVEEDRKNLAENFKKKLDELTTVSNKTVQAANNAKSNHDRTVASLTAQNIQLKKRIEADALAAKNRQQNPFAAESGNSGDTKKGPIATSVDAKIAPVNIAKEYAIMEIIGKGDNLTAKLINKDGESFLARKGTVLHTGHSIEDITQNYIQFDRNGLKDYLYTSNSAMTTEPDKMDGTATTDKTQQQPPAAKPAPSVSGISSDKGIPSLGTGMFIK
jgi:hypothetical protein